MHLPNWQLVPDVRAKHFIPVSLMPVPVEKGIESTEAFKLLKKYLLKICLICDMSSAVGKHPGLSWFFQPQEGGWSGK